MYNAHFFNIYVFYNVYNVLLLLKNDTLFKS